LRAPRLTPFPYTTLFRSQLVADDARLAHAGDDDAAAAALEQIERLLEALVDLWQQSEDRFAFGAQDFAGECLRVERRVGHGGSEDRKSTRLNSSHVKISY